MKEHYLLQQTNCTIENCRVRRNTPQKGIAVVKRMGVPWWNENWDLSYWCEFQRSNGIELTKAHLLWTQTQALSKLPGAKYSRWFLHPFLWAFRRKSARVTLLRVSGLLDYFESNADIFKGYYIYGDPAYPISKWIISGYRGNNLDQKSIEKYVLMLKWASSVRESNGTLEGRRLCGDS